MIRKTLLVVDSKQVGDCKCDRLSRHRGDVSVWPVMNRDRAQQKIDRLSIMHDAIKENPKAAATDYGQIEFTQSITNKKLIENASK